MKNNLQKLLLVPLIGIAVSANAQQGKVIQGVIRDEQGKALSGVTVGEINSSNQTMSDEKGHFKIVLQSSYSLNVSAIGFKPQQITANHLQGNVQVVLVSDVTTLSDVVVVGYGTQSKAKVTGAISTIKMDDVLGDRPVSNLGTLLQGSSPGLQVSINSGKPGASTSWNIRGGTGFGTSATSGFNSNGPFILVDNVPYNGPTNLLDPNDIESVTVLKDAGSAAIYGARSAFGVVLITTKSGKKNTRTSINYSNNLVFSNPINLPKKASPLDQVKAWADGGMASVYNGNQNLATWTQLLNDYKSDPSKFPNGYTFDNGVFYQLAPTDAVKDLLGNTAFQQMHNVAVGGGNDKTAYRISGGITNENGIMVPKSHQDNFKRYNIKTVVNTDLADWLNVQLDGGYNSSTNLSPFYTNAFGNAVNLPSTLATDSIPGIKGILNTAKNQIMASEPVNNKIDDIRFTGRMVLKPLAGLTLTGEYTIDNNWNQTTSYDKKVSGFLNPYGYTAESIGSDKFTKSNAVTRYNAVNLFGSYTKAFDQHNIVVTAGFNQEENKYEIQSTTASDMLNPDLPFLSGTTGLIPFTASDNYLDYATRGYFARVNYDFMGRYMLQVNGRYDGSSKFPENNRWGFFPSVSVGWRLSEEAFMKGLKDVVSEFKLRASYGSVGNQSIGDYQFYAGMTSYIPNWLYNSLRVGTLNPPILIGNGFTWETVNTKNFGVDFGFLKNRLTGSFEWYQRDTKDILTTNPTPLPVILGTAAPLQNAGALRTKGFELQVNWKDRIGAIEYRLGANLYNYDSEVTNAINPQNVVTNGTLYVGKKMGEIWGYTTDRFFTTNDFVDGTLNQNLRGGTLKEGLAKQNGQAPNPGDILYVDYNKDGIINSGAGTLEDSGDYRVIGNSTPKYQFGISGGVTYKNFDFSFVAMGVGKQDLWINNTLTFPNQWLTYGALYEHQTNYWTPENTNAFYGRIYTDNVNSPNQGYNQIVQSKFLYNGAYLRIQNLTLGYHLPTSWLQQIKVSKLQLFVSVENPYTFTHMPKGMYPDLAVQGSTAGGGLGYPFMRKTSFGINMTY